MSKYLTLILAFTAWQASAETMPRLEKEYLCVNKVLESQETPVIVKTKMLVEGIIVKFIGDKNLTEWDFACNYRATEKVKTVAKCDAIEIRNEVTATGHRPYTLSLKKIGTNQIELTYEVENQTFNLVRCQKREI